MDTGFARQIVESWTNDPKSLLMTMGSPSALAKRQGMALHSEGQRERIWRKDVPANPPMVMATRTCDVVRVTLWIACFYAPISDDDYNWLRVTVRFGSFREGEFHYLKEFVMRAEVPRSVEITRMIERTERYLDRAEAAATSGTVEKAMARLRASGFSRLKPKEA